MMRIRSGRGAAGVRAVAFGLLLVGLALSDGAARAQAPNARSGERLGGEAPGSHAVVFIYHRFGDSKLPSTNIRLDQFDAHLKELRDGGYNVLPLPDIVAALKAGEPLADKTVGLSIDDAYLSLYEHAWPRLRAAGLPFTIFIATEAIDRKASGFMTWDQLRELAASGLVTIGSQTVSHPHMPLVDGARNADELDKSAARIAAEIGKPPALFAYPYGEMSLEVKGAVRKAGFAAAFGQHSGVAHAGEDFFYLPRFSLNERFGDMARFRMAARALPLPVDDLTPADPYLSRDNPPAFGFTVTGNVGDIRRLNCYHADQTLKIERLGERRIEVRLAKAFPPGRARLNCTLPAGADRWRWFGMQFLVPYPPGQAPPD